MSQISNALGSVQPFPSSNYIPIGSVALAPSIPPYAPTASTKLPLSSSIQANITTTNMQTMNNNTIEESKRTSHKGELPNDKTNILFGQIQFLLGDLNRTINEEVKEQETVKTLNTQLYHFKVHLEGLQEYIFQKEHFSKILESQIASLKKENELLRGNNSNHQQGTNASQMNLVDGISSEQRSRANGDEGNPSPTTSPMQLYQAYNNALASQTSTTPTGKPRRSYKKRKSTKRSSKANDATDSEDDVATHHSRDNHNEDSSEDSTEPESEPRASLYAPASQDPVYQNFITQPPKQKRKRGKLPDSATNLLKQWILEHKYHPYPSEEEKSLMCVQTNLTMNQINNWFTNARRRFLQKQIGNQPSVPSSQSNNSQQLSPSQTTTPPTPGSTTPKQVDSIPASAPPSAVSFLPPADTNSTTNLQAPSPSAPNPASVSPNNETISTEPTEEPTVPSDQISSTIEQPVIATSEEPISATPMVVVPNEPSS